MILSKPLNIALYALFETAFVIGWYHTREVSHLLSPDNVSS